MNSSINEEEFLLAGGYDSTIHVKSYDGNGNFRGFGAKSTGSIKAIRIITKGAMQSRFSISEEVAINSGTDETARVLLSRLLNSKNINLDLEEFTSGLGYIVPYLASIDMLYLGASIEERMDKLTENGTADEAYP